MQADKERIIFHINGFANYFRGLAESENEQINSRSFEWRLGLFMANRLLRLAQSDSIDIEELKLLVAVLEQGDFGSGWFDLTLQANNLLRSCEKN